MIPIVPEEVEREVVPSIESEFETAKGQQPQKEEYIGPCGSFSRDFALLVGLLRRISRHSTLRRAFESRAEQHPQSGHRDIEHSQVSVWKLEHFNAVSIHSAMIMVVRRHWHSPTPTKVRAASTNRDAATGHPLPVRRLLDNVRCDAVQWFH